MTGKLVSGLVAVAALAGAYLLALDLASGTRLVAENRAEEAGAGPQVVLRGVEVIETRRGGKVYRLVSDEALYAVLASRVTASVVTLALAERNGGIVVTAPVLAWNMEDGRIDLVQGASARNGGGWTASAPGARIDLKSREITAEEAVLSGPGVTVAGRNLRWRWHDGSMDLDFPRSTVLPGKVRSPERKG